MSFGGLVLTNAGRNELIRAELGEKFSLTHVVLGEGSYSGSYMTIGGLVGEVMRIPITRTSRTDEGVLLECDFNSLDAPRGFYLREIGIIANGALCYYDNSRDDAEYIDPDANVLVKQKRMRFILMISPEIEVDVRIASSLYALAEDLEGVIHPRYEEAVSLTVPGDQENIWEILGKVKRAIKEQIAHYGNYDNPHNTDKAQVGLPEVDNTSDRDKPVSIAQQTAIDGAYQQATGYTDQQIAKLINGADSSLDTLGEIAQAMKDNEDVVQALDQAIGTKANQAEVDGHTGNATIHITASERQSWNGKQTMTGDTKDNVVSFTSSDTASPTGWSDITLISSGEKHNSLWHKVSLFARNVRYLWKLMGSTSLNGIGDGTVTGAISQLNTGLEWQQINFDDVVSIVETYVTIDYAWPHTAWKNKNLIQLDFKIIVNTNPGGTVFLKIAEDCIPVTTTYLLPDGGTLIDGAGNCTAWINPGAYFVHVVYAFNG